MLSHDANVVRTENVLLLNVPAPSWKKCGTKCRILALFGSRNFPMPHTIRIKCVVIGAAQKLTANGESRARDSKYRPWLFTIPDGKSYTTQCTMPGRLSDWSPPDSSTDSRRILKFDYATSDIYRVSKSEMSEVTEVWSCNVLKHKIHKIHQTVIQSDC